jgi:phosphoserine phosphatase
MSELDGVVAFDLDGTLVPRTTVCIHLARWLGHEERLIELEMKYGAGQVTNRTVADEDAGHYKGRSRADVWAQLDTVDVIGGIPETVAWLKARRFAPIVATVTWRFAAEHFQHRYGFEAACGCEMDESPDGTMLGVVRRHLAAVEKARFVVAFARGRSVSTERVVAVGDGTSDLPLFREAGLAIALNATKAAREAADVSLDTDDLRDVLPVIEERLLPGGHGVITEGCE